jgi:CubicO group peptidase (beta-lactamase class C family)
MRAVRTLTSILIALSSLAAAPPDMTAAWQRLDAFVLREMREHRIPGVSLALTDRQRLLRVKTYGYANLDSKAPLTPDHLLEIGSISKSFTSIALLQLRDEGRFDPRKPVTEYLPWFSIQSSFDPITAHHLMTHTAALPRDRDDIVSSLYQAVALRDRVTGEAPGQHYRYSNIGYQVLSYMLEELSGKPYAEIIRARILEPLGMTHTVPAITHDLRPRLAVGYESLYDDRPSSRDYPLVPGVWTEYGAGDGSISATPADLAAYVRMLLNRGAGPRGRILSEDGFNLLIHPVIDAGDNWSYAYGLDTRQAFGHTFVAHSGGMVGYYARILADLDSGLGVAVMINGPGEPVRLASYALLVLESASHKQPLPPMPVADPPARLKNAAEYAGSYASADGRTLRIAAEGDRLFLFHGGKKLVLETRDDDAFFVPHPDFALFLLRFGRTEGKVVEAFYGPDWYAGESYAGTREFDYPKKWDAYPGHYRTPNPWEPNFRIVVRKGKLVFLTAEGEEEVTPLGGGEFRVGEDYSAERLTFDTVIGGKTLQANLSGIPYFRTFTP